MSLLPNVEADVDKVLKEDDSEDDATVRITRVYIEQEDDVPEYVTERNKKKIRSFKLRHEGKLSTDVLDQVIPKLVALGINQDLLEEPPRDSHTYEGTTNKLFVPFYQVMRSQLETLGDYVIAPLHTFEKAFSLFAREEGCQPKQIGWMFEVGLNNEGVVEILDNYFAIDERSNLEYDGDFRRMGEAIEALDQVV